MVAHFIQYMGAEVNILEAAPVLDLFIFTVKEPVHHIWEILAKVTEATLRIIIRCSKYMTRIRIPWLNPILIGH